MKYFKTLLLILIVGFFLACDKENTTEPIVTDIKSLTIDSENITIYSTDAPIAISATVSYTDGTSANAEFAQWSNSDYEVMNVASNTLWGGISNGGEANLEIKFEAFNDSKTVTIHKLTSFFIATDDIITTGDFILEAKGSFENNETNRTIVKNIVWSADNGAVITTSDDDIVTITIASGDTNVTATVFSDTNLSSPIAPVSKVYSLN